MPNKSFLIPLNSYALHEILNGHLHAFIITKARHQHVIHTYTHRDRYQKWKDARMHASSYELQPETFRYMYSNGTTQH